MQPRQNSKQGFEVKLRKKSRIVSEYSKSLQFLATKSSGACQTRGYGTAHVA
jgi:hypothetical protein